MSEKSTRPTTISDVCRALARPLPGIQAQLRLAPAYRLEALRDRTPPSAPKQAGVLILFYACDHQLFFPLTRRTDTVENHRGQISLPGGAREGDESLRDTALRETYEELRIPPDDLTILGSLTPLYVPPSGFLINPFVAYTPTQPVFDPDPVEVAELIETPLSLLLDPATLLRQSWELHGTPVEVPFFHVYSHKVWGATAMVLSELVTLLREVLP